MERLKPFEKLDEDYYLDDHTGWGSDGCENCDSDSSTDEMREEVKSKFSDVLCSDSSIQRGVIRNENDCQVHGEFECDMDNELSERLVAHVSRFMIQPGIQSICHNTQQSNSILSRDIDGCSATMKEDDDNSNTHSLGLKAEESFNAENSHENCSTSANEKVTDSSSSKKSVCFKEGPDEIFGVNSGDGHDDDSTMDIERINDDVGKNLIRTSALDDGAEDGGLLSTADPHSTSAYNDKNNLLKKLVDRAMMKNKKKRQGGSDGHSKKEIENEDEDVQFYDPNEDDDNEIWVEEHRKRLGMLPIESRSETQNESTSKEREKKLNDDTDAVLSCPACLTLLTRQCQRHELYRDQYRAIFVENCKIISEESLFMPESNARKRKGKGSETKKCTAEKQPKPYTLISSSEAAKLGRDDLFHPVQCAICSTAVGVYDAEEIYHFFNVLTGYA